mmetsp:Transcript_24436/g.69645  ORF Transcript_24436/g.69645 Transcript_24436/m.69645 type:complete len:362 (+) Transcript_24436:812-1897(+)
MVREADQLSHLLDGLSGARHEQLLLLDEPQLPRGLVANQHRVVLVDLHRLPLAAVQDPLVRPQEHLAPTGAPALNTDVAGSLVQDLAVLVHFQVDRGKHRAVEQTLVRPREDDALTSVDADLPCYRVEQSDVLVGLQRPGLQRLLCVGLELPRRLQEHLRLALLDPTLPARLVLQANVLVLLKNDRVELLRGALEGLREPNAGPAHGLSLPGQPVFYEDVLGPAHADRLPGPRLVMGAREPHARASEDRPLAAQLIRDDDELRVVEAHRGALRDQLVVGAEEQKLRTLLDPLRAVLRVAQLDVLCGGQSLRLPDRGATVGKWVHHGHAWTVLRASLQPALDEKLLLLAQEVNRALEQHPER